MKHFQRLITLHLLTASLFVLCKCAFLAQAASAPRSQRIVSLAPSVTETLFALGFGNRVVGVTTYCDYPAEAKKLPKVGGFMSPSLEAIAAKRPDFVIGVSSATDPVKAREMERLGLKVTLISLASVNDILTSIKSIARLLGNPDAGEKLVGKIILQFDEIKKRVASAPRRTTLLAVGLRPLVVVGGKNFINELIFFAGGGKNAGKAEQTSRNLPDEHLRAKAPQWVNEAGIGSQRGGVVK